jgi:hypothetical protein
VFGGPAEDKPMLRYIELKTGYADNGPAWIARVTLSKSGRTVYFNGKALKRAVRGGIIGNHRELGSQDWYWVSGVKKDGLDRHWAGSGKVMIERSAVPEYLALVAREKLDPTRFTVIEDLPPTDPAAFVNLENKRLGE